MGDCDLCFAYWTFSGATWRVTENKNKLVPIIYSRCTTRPAAAAAAAGYWYCFRISHDVVSKLGNFQTSQATAAAAAKLTKLLIFRFVSNLISQQASGSNRDISRNPGSDEEAAAAADNDVSQQHIVAVQRVTRYVCWGRNIAGGGWAGRRLFDCLTRIVLIFNVWLNYISCTIAFSIALLVG